MADSSPDTSARVPLRDDDSDADQPTQEDRPSPAHLDPDRNHHPGEHPFHESPNHDHHHEHHHDHHHDHCDDHDHDSWLPHSHGLTTHAAVRDETRLAAALLLYLALTAGESIAALASHSRILAVEAVHSLLDALTVTFALISLRVAQRPANRAFATFGFARAEVLTALLSVLWLFTLMAILLASSVRVLAGFAEADEVHGRIMVAAAAAALLTNVVVQVVLAPRRGASAAAGGNGAAEAMNVKAARAHALADSMESVVALVVGAALSVQPAWHVLDPLLSIGVGVLVIAVNWKIVSEAWGVLMEFVPRTVNTSVLEGDLLDIRGVEGVEALHVWTIGMSRLVGAARIRAHCPSGNSLETFEGVRLEAQKAFLSQKVGDQFIEVVADHGDV